MKSTANPTDGDGRLSLQKKATPLPENGWNRKELADLKVEQRALNAQWQSEKDIIKDSDN